MSEQAKQRDASLLEVLSIVACPEQGHIPQSTLPTCRLVCKDAQRKVDSETVREVRVPYESHPDLDSISSLVKRLGALRKLSFVPCKQHEYGHPADGSQQHLEINERMHQILLHGVVQGSAQGSTMHKVIAGLSDLAIGNPASTPYIYRLLAMKLQLHNSLLEALPAGLQRLQLHDCTLAATALSTALQTCKGLRSLDLVSVRCTGTSQQVEHLLSSFSQLTQLKLQYLACDRGVTFPLSWLAICRQLSSLYLDVPQPQAASWQQNSQLFADFTQLTQLTLSREVSYSDVSHSSILSCVAAATTLESLVLESFGLWEAEDKNPAAVLTALSHLTSLSITGREGVVAGHLAFLGQLPRLQHLVLDAELVPDQWCSRPRCRWCGFLPPKQLPELHLPSLRSLQTHGSVHLLHYLLQAAPRLQNLQINLELMFPGSAFDRDNEESDPSWCTCEEEGFVQALRLVAERCAAIPHFNECEVEEGMSAVSGASHLEVYLPFRYCDNLGSLFGALQPLGSRLVELRVERSNHAFNQLDPEDNMLSERDAKELVCSLPQLRRLSAELLWVEAGALSQLRKLKHLKELQLPKSAVPFDTEFWLPVSWSS